MDTRKDKRPEDMGADRPSEAASDSDEIARLAYRYYHDRGCIEGMDQEDWYRAEREIRNMRQQNITGEGANAQTKRSVIGVFHSMDEAQRAFDDLQSQGFTRDEISFVANKASTSEWTERTQREAVVKADDKSADVAADAGIGAAVGGVGGLLLSFAGAAVPGIGPVLAAGPIIAALGGAGVGAAAGGLIGVLVEGGVPEEDAAYYAEGVRRGGILITVIARGERADRAAEILDRHGAVDIDDRVSEWRSRGWTTHDPAAAPLTSDEIRREREYLRAKERQSDEWTARARSEDTPAGGKTEAGRTARTGRKHARREKAEASSAPVRNERQAEARRRAARIYGGMP
jgi:hypothetical protein